MWSSGEVKSADVEAPPLSISLTFCRFYGDIKLTSVHLRHLRSCSAAEKIAGILLPVSFRLVGFNTA